MAWTAPRTWVASEVVTAAQLNAHIRDNLLALVPTTPLLFSTGDSILFVKTGTGRYKAPIACTLVSVTATCGVEPTDADVIVDVNKDAVTMFTTQGNRPTVPDGTFEGAKATPDVTAIAVADLITVDIDQIGSTLPGENLTVILEITIP